MYQRHVTQTTQLSCSHLILYQKKEDSKQHGIEWFMTTQYAKKRNLEKLSFEHYKAEKRAISIDQHSVA